MMNKSIKNIISSFQKKIFKISEPNLFVIECEIDKILSFLKYQNIKSKILGKFLLTIVNLIRNIIIENKAIEEETEELNTKFCELFSFYIEIEMIELQNCSEKSTKPVLEKILTRIKFYLANELNIVKSLAICFLRYDLPQNQMEKIEAGFNEFFNHLFQTTIRRKIIRHEIDILYYLYIYKFWQIVCDKTDQREKIEKLVMILQTNVLSSSLEMNLMECFQNGIEKIKENIQRITFNKSKDNNICNFDCSSKTQIQSDIFDCCTFNFDTVEWLKKIQKTQYNHDVSIDLTESDVDSDIEIEFPSPIEMIEIDDNEQLVNEHSTFKRIGIQERRNYLPLKDDESNNLKSFAAFRRKSIMLLEGEMLNKMMPVAREVKKKSASLTNNKAMNENSRIKNLNQTTKNKKCTKSKNFKEAFKKMTNCSVIVEKIKSREIAKYRRKKLSLVFFIEKYGTVVKSKSNNVHKTQLLENSSDCKEGNCLGDAWKKNLKDDKELSDSIDDFLLNSDLCYPDHTHPNLSILQILPEKQVTKIKATKRRSLKDSLVYVERESNPSKYVKKSTRSKSVDESKLIVNDNENDIESWSTLSKEEAKHELLHNIHDFRILDHPYASFTAYNNDSISTCIEPSPMRFDNISDNEEEANLENFTISKDILEETLGTRASLYSEEIEKRLKVSPEMSNQKKSRNIGNKLKIKSKRLKQRKRNLKKNFIKHLK